MIHSTSNYTVLPGGTSGQCASRPESRRAVASAELAELALHQLLHEHVAHSGRLVLGGLEPLARCCGVTSCLVAAGQQTPGFDAREGLKAAQDEAAAVGYVFMEQLVHGELRELRGRDCTP